MNHAALRQEDLDEAFARVLEGDDEASDDEGIGDLLGGLLPPVVSNLLPGVLSPSRPAPRPSFVPPVPGVQTANFNTPQGQATVRLPEPVVTERAFKEAFSKLETTIGRLSNEVSVQRVSVASALSSQRSMLAATKKSLNRIKKRQADSATTGMLITLMMQQNSRRQLLAHQHVDTHAQVDAASVGGDNSMMLAMLPMMMDGFGSSSGSSEDKGSDSSSMMMMMMLMMSMSK